MRVHMNFLSLSLLPVTAASPSACDSPLLLSLSHTRRSAPLKSVQDYEKASPLLLTGLAFHWHVGGALEFVLGNRVVSDQALRIGRLPCIELPVALAHRGPPTRPMRVGRAWRVCGCPRAKRAQPLCPTMGPNARQLNMCVYHSRLSTLRMRCCHRTRRRPCTSAARAQRCRRVRCKRAS